MTHTVEVNHAKGRTRERGDRVIRRAPDGRVTSDFARFSGNTHELAQALAKARPDQAELIARQVERLTGREQMGELFKAVAIHRMGSVPPGFAT